MAMCSSGAAVRHSGAIASAKSAGRHSHGETDQRWDDRGTERGCRSLESDHALRGRR
jgi:hypothetical protein